jgi:hypothetical protein
MSETSWNLTGVDPDARDRAVEEAARRGVSLGDYLTDIVLQNALAEQMRSQGEVFAEEAEPLTDMALQNAIAAKVRSEGFLGESEPFADMMLESALAEPTRSQSEGLLEAAEPAPTPGQSFAIRHQIKTLERHLGSSVASLDGALNALDTSLVGLGGRLGALESQAGRSAEALSEQVQNLHMSLAALRMGLANAESAAKASGETNERAHASLADACGELEQRLEGIEAIARGAESAATQLALAQNAFRGSLAQDLDALSRETAAHVSAGLAAGLAQVRAAADEAAAQADAAAAHLITELRAVRQGIDKRLAESAAETKHRMQAAFAESGERIAALADRIAVGERQSETRAEHVRAQIADMEDGVQTALEETALALRRADAVLASDIVRAAETSRTALDALRADVAAETAAMHERQLNAGARLANVEARVTAAAEQVATRQEALDRRVSAASAELREALGQVDATISEQFDIAASRASELEQDIAHVRRALGAEINRVEACTLAALETQAQDRSASDAMARRAMDEQAIATRSAIEDMRQRVEEQVAALRGQQANAQARFDTVAAALANDGPFATVISATADEVASLRTRVLGIQAADREAAGRAAKLEEADLETAKKLETLRNRVETMAAEVPGQSERLHAVELSVADLRLSHLAAASASVDEASEAVLAVRARVAELEERQTDAFHRLRNDISQFIADNERRLAQLEEAAPDLAAPFMAIEQRLAELEQHDVGVVFAELRARIEERVLGVEQRNVRTLEQLSETVALIERRFSDDDERAARSA